MKLRPPPLPSQNRSAARPRGGYVILAVLIAIVVLSLVAYRFTDAMTAEYRAGVRARDDAQVKLAAVSGLHYAAAALSDPTTFNNDLSANPYDNQGVFQQQTVAAADGSTTGPAYFSIRAVSMDSSGNPQQLFGVIDEGGKLNINALMAIDPSGQLLHDALMQLAPLGMTEDLADSIVDWVDSDDTPRSNGAESSYYNSLNNPYQAKNGPLNSLDELLMVKGMTPYLLYGGDANRNGVQDAGEQDNSRGFADYLTVYGRELNIDSTGVARIYLNDSDLNSLYQQLQQAVGADMANYILAYKLLNGTKTSSSTTTAVAMTTTTTDSDGDSTVKVTVAAVGTSQSNSSTQAATSDQVAQAVQAKLSAGSAKGQRINSITDLIGTQVTLPKQQGAPANSPTYVASCPLNDPSQLSQLLPTLLDKTTVQQAIEMVPRINVNTAPLYVLLAIPGMTNDLATNVINNRANQTPTDPATSTGAWLVTSNTLTAAQYKQMEKYITGRTMVYRVQSIGYIGQNGPMARMEAVIDTNRGAPRFLYIRDLSDIENPRGFQPVQTGP